MFTLKNLTLVLYVQLAFFLFIYFNHAWTPLAYILSASHFLEMVFLSDISNPKNLVQK